MRVLDQLELLTQLLPRGDGATQREAAGQRDHNLRHGATERSPPLHRGSPASGKQTYLL